MSSVRGGGRGEQRPRVCHVPSAVGSAGDEAVELSRLAGLHLDEWQEFVIRHALGERGDGKWAAFEVGLCVPRQNGKGGILEARELAGLFILGERLIIHSAHQFDTSLEAFGRLLSLIEETPDLAKRVQRVVRSHGEEGITLKGGQRIRFRTRTKGGGRGFSADCVILDEAMFMPETTHAALLPVVSARENPQVWYTGSAVDQESHEHGVVFSRVRDRALRGDDPRLAYFEWSLDAESPDEVDGEVATDPAVWAEANPALGIRIDRDHIGAEQRSMDRRSFAVERLGVGDWPAVDGSDDSMISLEEWSALVDERSGISGAVCFAIDVSPDRSWTTISAAGRRDDDLFHVEVVDRRRGTGWVVPRCVELRHHHDVDLFVLDAVGPAAALLEPLAEAGIEVETITTTEHARSCGLLFDSVRQGTVRHLGTGEIEAAIRGAAVRPLGDAWAWSRKNSRVDITSLVSVTQALGAAYRASVKSEVMVAWA